MKKMEGVEVDQETKELMKELENVREMKNQNSKKRKIEVMESDENITTFSSKSKKNRN